MRSKRCFLPSHVEDQRYPPDSIKYIYALHNHPYDSRISDDDIAFIVAEGGRHAFEVETRDGTIRLSIIAFFSDNPESPTCDGFYQYIPVTSQILKWTNARSKWDCEQTHSITWWDDRVNFSVEETRAPCFKEEVP